MGRIPGIRRYLGVGRASDSIRRQIDDELAFHFAMCVDELVAGGMSADDARREAERRFGDVDVVRERLARLDGERLREQRRADWWGAARQDARYAARGLRRSVGFTLGVVITLALGIGANAAVFTVVDRLLLRPPPHVVDGGTLRRLYVEMINPAGAPQDLRGPMSYAELTALRAVKSFASIGAFTYPSKVALGRGVDAPRVKRSGVSADFLTTLGVRPRLGRFFVPEDDDDRVTRPAAVVSYGLWQRRFGGSASVVGDSIVLNGRPYVIVGVAPKGFSGTDLDAPDVWVPLAAQLAGDDGPKWRENKMGFGLHVFARLRPDVTEERSMAEASRAIVPAYAGTFFETWKMRVATGSVIPGRRLGRTDADISVATRLVGAAAIVLLIACANVANLLLARALARRRELAVRLALGVSRGRLMAQLLTESLILACIAGLAALVVAVWGGSALRGLIMPDTSWASPPVDARVLLFTGGVAFVVGLVAGLAPALQMTRPDLVGSLKAGWRDMAGRRSVVQSGLILVQAAFTVILLVGAGLFVRSLHNARTLDVGFAIDRTILVDVGFARGALPGAQRDAAYDAIAQRVEQAPGVARVAVANATPYWTLSFERLWIPGIDSLPPDLKAAPISAVDPRYFATMGMRVTDGRGIAADDRANAPLVAVVNAALARKAWPGQSPLGRCLKVGADTAPCTTVVGVVPVVGFTNLREDPTPQYYIPLAQSARYGHASRYVVVRVDDRVRDVADVAATVRGAIRGARADFETLNVRPYAQLLDAEIRPFKLGATMFGVFGALALLLAAVGLYAVISFGVARRTREIGIRSALGAGRAEVVRLVMTEGVRLTVVGVALGVALSLALGRVVEALLFGASARDPVVFAVVSVSLLAAATLACAIPAWRAARVDPLVALREE